MKVRLQLYTVPGQVFYNTTRRLVLKGVDGVVFVADSQLAAREANRESLVNLQANLEELGLSTDAVPLVFQYNKRDIRNIIPVETLQEDLNPKNAPHFEAAAVHGLGVFETLKVISRMALANVKARIAEEDRRQQVVEPAPVAARPRPRPDADPRSRTRARSSAPLPQPPITRSRPSCPRPLPKSTATSTWTSPRRTRASTRSAGSPSWRPSTSRPSWRSSAG